MRMSIGINKLVITNLKATECRTSSLAFSSNDELSSQRKFDYDSGAISKYVRLRIYQCAICSAQRIKLNELSLDYPTIKNMSFELVCQSIDIFLYNSMFFLYNSM